MTLQKSVGLIPAIGVEGQEVVVGQAVYLAFNPLSDGTVKAGAFAFKGTASGNGEEFGYASATGSALLGFVERVVDASIPNIKDAFTGVYPAGFKVTVAIRGQFYAKAPSAISADGLKVYVDGTTGAVTVAAAPESGSDAIDTGWVCRIPNGGTSAAKGDTVIFEKF